MHSPERLRKGGEPVRGDGGLGAEGGAAEGDGDAVRRQAEVEGARRVVRQLEVEVRRQQHADADVGGRQRHHQVVAGRAESLEAVQGAEQQHVAADDERRQQRHQQNGHAHEQRRVHPLLRGQRHRAQRRRVDVRRERRVDAQLGRRVQRKGGRVVLLAARRRRRTHGG